MRWLFLVAALLLLAAPAAAQPMDTYGMGSRSMAMAGAVTADVEDYSANYYNPAGVVRSGQLGIGVGWFGVDHNLSLNGVDSNVDPVHGITLGLNVPGAIDDFRFAFGLGLHLNDQRVSRSRSLPRARPRWEFYDNRPQRTFIAVHLAIQPVEWLRIGGGIGFLSYSANALQVRGVIDFAAPEARSDLEHQLRGELFTIRYPQVGVQVTPIEWLNIGLVYRGEYALDTLLTAEVGAVDATGAPTLSDPDATAIRAGTIDIPGYFFLLTQSVGSYSPHQISLGVSIDPIEWLHISLEATWLMWSMYVSPLGRADIVLDITVPPELAAMIEIPDIPSSTQQPSNFRDRVVPRLGIEAQAFRDEDIQVDVRVGYFYEYSPIPDQTGFANLVDTDRHAWSLGLGLELLDLRPLLPGSLAFNAHFMYAWLPARTMEKTSPIDPVGDYVAEGHMFSGGLSIEARFE